MSAKPRILVLYAHPASHRSRLNRLLVEAVRTVPNVVLHDLYDTYPDFHIDVSHEQALLKNVDLVVFQYPLQWYSVPALLKEWFDAVLEFGWAYGTGGRQLHGKDCWLTVTTGAGEEKYLQGGEHGQSMSTYLLPIEQTAKLCGLRWHAPYIVYGAHQLDQQSADAYAAYYRNRLASYPDWQHSTDDTPLPIAPSSHS